MNGVGDGYFAGDEPVTRGQLAQVLKNLADTGAITINNSVQSATTSQQPETQPNSTTANVVTLGPGTFNVGTDINAGRYVVSTNNRGGNFFVYDLNGDAVVNQMLGNGDSLYVNNITVDLSKGQKIEIDGLQSVQFTPKQ